MNTTTKKRNYKQRVKIMLMAGKTLTKRGLDRLLDVTNSAEIINQLRKDEMPIVTIWKVSENGLRYGEYRYIAPKKVSRLKSRQYLEQAYPKGL